MSGKEGKVGAGVGSGNTGKAGGSPCGEQGMMVAPGQKGECINRDAFESNPKGYFADLHAQEKDPSKAKK